MDDALLKVRWDELVTACGLSVEKAERYYHGLLRAYSEPHRAYHNPNHLQHVFAELKSAGVANLAVAWAVWYHDAIYRPGAKDNEARSADLARQEMKALGLAPDLIARVAQLILATRSHQGATADTVEVLFLDADLAILGAAPDEYESYKRAIRAEHGNVPSLLYNRGRRQFLRQMLQRPRIFQSDHFYARYEERARANMAEELAG